MILCIETATDVCSVALCNDERVVSLREKRDGRYHSALLSVFIKEILEENKIQAQNLDAVAVSKGPGSYTGLRIGVATAKGLAYGADIPLIGTDTLTSMFYGALQFAESRNAVNDKTIFCPAIDARRMEVYYCLFDRTGKQLGEIKAEIIKINTFSNLPSDYTLIFFGSGASKCMEVINRERKIIIEDFSVSAALMRVPALKAFGEKKFENITYFEPLYLKDFLATKPKRKVI